MPKHITQVLERKTGRRLDDLLQEIAARHGAAHIDPFTESQIRLWLSAVAGARRAA
jgi:hypothetical protein